MNTGTDQEVKMDGGLEMDQEIKLDGLEMDWGLEANGLEAKLQLKKIRRAGARIGLGYVLLILVGNVAVALIFFGITVSGFSYSASPYTVLLSILPMYLFGLPACWLALGKLPSARPQVKSMGPGTLAMALFICLAIVYLGNLLGTYLMVFASFVTGHPIANPLEAMVQGSDTWISIVATVLLAPIIEEFVFRRLLISRLKPYGEGLAVLVAALMFALFHGNFYQFFYALGLGLVFGFVYVKTGKLRYTIGLHVVVNFLGIVVNPYMSRAGGAVSTAYFVFVLLAVVLGLFFLVFKRKAVVFAPMEGAMLFRQRFGAVAVNWGMGIFLLISLLLFYVAIKGSF